MDEQSAFALRMQSWKDRWRLLSETSITTYQGRNMEIKKIKEDKDTSENIKNRNLESCWDEVQVNMKLPSFIFHFLKYFNQKSRNKTKQPALKGIYRPVEKLWAIF